MGWGYCSTTYNSGRIPLITGYAWMQDRFKSVIPIRGRTQECKPLGDNRRMSWYEITENTNCYLSEEEPLGRLETSYACTLGSHDTVEFFKDGSIVLRDHSWHNPTSMGFMTFCVREFGNIESAGGKWYFRNKQGMQYSLGTDRNYELKLVKEGEFYVPTNPIQEFTYSAKRKELNKQRRYYKDFIDYVRTMLAMDNRISVEDNAEALGFQDRNLVPCGWSGKNSATNRSKFFELVEKAKSTNDLALSYSLAQYVVSCFGWYNYHNKSSECTPQAFVRGFAEMLKYEYADEVFEAIPVEIGKAFFNRNQKYVAPN